MAFYHINRKLANNKQYVTNWPYGSCIMVEKYITEEVCGGESLFTSQKMLVTGKEEACVPQFPLRPQPPMTSNLSLSPTP